MRRATLCGLSVLALAGSSLGAERVTQADLLRRIIDVQRLCTPPPVGERTAMFSSYDRRSRLDANGKQVDWDANQDWGNFLRHDADGWDVMAEMTGPGALTRIWSANPQGDIRIILDGEAVIDTQFAELLSGRLAPFAEPFVYRGLNCYFPLGYAQSCRVVCRDCKSYYQINYVQFPSATQVDRFKLELDEDAQAAADEVKQTFENGLTQKQLFGKQTPGLIAEDADVGPGKSLTYELKKAGTVRAFYVALTDKTNPRELYALHKCVLRIFVDGETVPAVEAPLCDFFGSGFDFAPFNSLAIGTNRVLEMPLPERMLGQDRFMYCYFPQPYGSGLRVEIASLSESKKPIGVLLFMQVDPRPLAADALRFHARYRREDPCRVLDYPILETTGRGRVVGCLLNVDCPRATWWGEGDDKVWIDGEKFPSYFGTGSEDYLGDAWGTHAHIRPLQGVTRVAPYGKQSAYRWHIPDCIDFQKSARFTIENWQFGGFKDTDYSTVAYWYAAPGAKDFFQPIKAADVTPRGLTIPGAVEIENHIVDPNWGNPFKEVYAGGFELSGGLAAAISTNQPVHVEIPSEATAAVHLKLRAVPRRPFETVTVTDAAGRTVGTVKYDRSATDGMYVVGVLRLDKGKNTVTVQCSGPALLDCFVLEPLRKVAHGLEGEDLKVASAGRAKIETEYGALDWSAGAQLAIEFAAVGDKVVLTLPEQTSEGPFVLHLHVTQSPVGGRFQALLDNRALGDPFDCYAEQPGIERIPFGQVTLSKGAHTLAFEALKSEHAGTWLGLDVVELAETISRYAVECEDLPVSASEGSHHEVQAIDGCSGGAQMFCKAQEAGAWIEFAVPVPKPGRYKLAVEYLKSFDYGIVQASANGEKAGEPVDTYAPAITPGTVVPLGEFELRGPSVRLKVQVVGKSEQSPGFFFGVDAVIVEPVK